MDKATSLKEVYPFNSNDNHLIRVFSPRHLKASNMSKVIQQLAHYKITYRDAKSVTSHNDVVVQDVIDSFFNILSKREIDRKNYTVDFFEPCNFDALSFIKEKKTNLHPMEKIKYVYIPLVKRYVILYFIFILCCLILSY